MVSWVLVESTLRRALESALKNDSTFKVLAARFASGSLARRGRSSRDFKRQDERPLHSTMSRNQQVGWVYLMRNRSMPGKVKIGFTFDDPRERANQLSSSTAVPSPFVVIYALKTAYPRDVEFALHHITFYKRRVTPNREFFSSDLYYDDRKLSEREENEWFSLKIKGAARIFTKWQRFLNKHDRLKEFERSEVKCRIEMSRLDFQIIGSLAQKEVAL